MRIRGEIVDIRFRNNENGYTVAVLDVDGEPVVTAGIFPSAIEGQYVVADGDYVVHPRFGRQFKAELVREVRPDTLDGIVRYLGSGVIKGIGPVLALRIVNTFGDKTFDVIEYSPEKLARVSGISKRKAMEISESYGKIKVMQDAMMFLQRYGITTNTAMKIYAVYGKDTVKTVSANPYALIEDVDGIGFYSADKIARSMGVEKNGWFRARAGTVFTLKESARLAGNTFLPERRLIADASKLLDVDENVVEGAVEKLAAERKIKRFDLEEPSVMLTSMYRVEKGVATALIKLIDYADKLEYDCGGEIAEYEKLYGINFHEDQKRAISLAINSGVVLVTGGPGTGKTTIIKCILHILKNLGMTAALMAPTGRAAKRMSEATGAQASTIHRALGLKREEYAAEAEPLSADVVIVDEFSMVDIFLMKSLLDHVSPGTRLVLVGDKDQLASVGAGNVLADVIASGLFKITYLDKIYRQSDGSMIIENAHLINHGKMPVLDNRAKDFFFVDKSDPTEVKEEVEALVTTRLPKYLKCEQTDVQVLCPMKKGVAGVISLNAAIRDSLNPKKDSSDDIKCGEYTFREGDKIMQTVNNYEQEWFEEVDGRTRRGAGVFNGDTGFIESIDRQNMKFNVRFDDNKVSEYSLSDIDQIIPAYAVSVHKSQGSEFKAVVVALSQGNYFIMTRNLLYTAVTRAKDLCVIVGAEDVVKRMVRNNYTAKRYTLLTRFLTEAYGEYD